MTHSANDIALADVPTTREQVRSWRTHLAQTDWTPWLIIGFAALLRFFLLGIKPPHFDEGINGWFVDQLIKNGFYRYDPTNYHGPLHFYVLFLSQTLFGRNLWALRLPVVLVSICCVWLTLKFEPFFGRNVSRLAALAMAVSPGFLFYGRYSIHEVWLVLFSMLFILGLLGLWRFGTTKYLWCTGMGVTGMILTKETYVIHLGCAVLAMPAVWLANLLPRLSVRKGKLAKQERGISELGQLLTALFAGCLLLAFCHPWLRTASPLAWLVLILSAVTLILSALKKNTRSIGIAAGVVSLLIIIYLIESFEGEVSAIAYGAMLGSVGLIAVRAIPSKMVLTLGPKAPLPDAKPAKQNWDLVDLAMVIAIGAALIVFFYSGTFFHWSGVKGLYQSYAAWFSTGQEGHGHEKPWYYWLKLVMRYEWPALIGLVLCLFAAWFRNVYLRYLAVYGFGTLIAYSIVNYKTPWCIVSVIWPFLFVFGAAASTGTMRRRIFYGACGAAAGAMLGVLMSYIFLPGSAREALSSSGKSYFSALIELIVLASSGDFSTRIGQTVFVTLCVFTVLGGLAGIIVAAAKSPNWFSEPVMRTIQNFAVYFALVGSFALSISLNYFRCTTDTEPYVYVQTYNDINKLTGPLLTLAKRSPIFYQLTGHIIRTSSYPLPWILGDFAHVGYYENKGLPQTVDADFLLVQSDRIEEIEPQLHNSYFTTPLTIRPYQDTSKLYFDAKKFKGFFPGRSPEFIGKGSG
jgi:predicted membrane-bound mannosyltransferase